ncbi:MAG: hypothetical protein R3B58_10710 [Phycisphaerales bacterium]
MNTPRIGDVSPEHPADATAAIIRVCVSMMIVRAGHVIDILA